MTLSRLAALCAVFLFALLVLVPQSRAQSSSTTFSWDQATIYRLITDRFSSGDRENNTAYGRGLDGEGTPYDVDSTGHFLGGDFAGLTGWINDNYFTDLGVNALLISAPFEQIHGWVGGGFGEYQRYGYDGRWPLDFTEIDLSLGTKAEFAELIAAARSKDIRVLLEVSLNHVGPPAMNDMAAFNFGGLTSDQWRNWRPASKTGWQSYNTTLVTLSDSATAWQRWWGKDWVRADLPGYEGCGSTPEQMCVNQMPDLRDDVEVSGIPAFLNLKWGADKSELEQGQLADFFTRTGYKKTATNHVIMWLTDWVAEFGIDGFVLRDAEHVNGDAIKRLKDQSVRALSEWRGANAIQEEGNEAFWIATDGVLSEPEVQILTANGIDAILNYGFVQDVMAAPDGQYGSYAKRFNAGAETSALSFVSAPTVGLYDRRSLKEVASRLLLSPGGVVIYYGDESGRPLGAGGVEELERANSMMNWSGFNEDLLLHWKKIGAFRAAHPAIAKGGHDMLQEAPYAFYRGVRVGIGTDEVVVVMGASGRTRINVSVVWPDDTVLRDAYTGSVSIVSFGQVTFTADPSGLLLIEEVK